MAADGLVTEMPVSAARHSGTMPDDEHLVAQIAAGDALAFGALRQRYHPRLYGYISRRCNDPYLTEEVEQDVWLTVWQQSSRFRSESKVSTWLISIAHHKAMGALRRRWPVPLDEVPEPFASSEYDPHSRLEASETRAAVANAIQRLSPLHRATLDLVLGQGLSLEEASHVMECPVGTVKSRLSYARKYLAQDLARQGGGPNGA